MLRKSFAGIVALVLVSAAVLGAQVKELPKAPVRPVNASIVDINSAPEADIAAIGIDRPVAKKIVEGRPYRSKRDLVTRQLLTLEQYNKIKDVIVAKQPPRK
jgi:DNA uptake protein ComE-like DNA-binding protein